MDAYGVFLRARVCALAQEFYDPIQEETWIQRLSQDLE